MPRPSPLSEILADFRRDLRFGARSLARQPVITGLVLLTLALGIGASAAIQGAVRATLVADLPYAAADELVLVWLDNERLGMRTDITSYPNHADTRDAATTLAGLDVYSPRAVTVTGATSGGGGGEPERLRTARLGSGVLGILGVEPVSGRGFEPVEDVEGSEPVALLGDGIWRRRFGADPDVLGRTVTLDGEAHRIVGVMPAGFDFPGDTEVWLPLAMSEDRRESRGSLWLYQIGRLAPGVGLEEAQAELDGIAARLREEHEGLDGYGWWVQPLRDHLVGEVRTPLLVLSAAVAFVLLIVCSNVANLLLARSAGRQREISLRLALGAGRGRLIRQLLTESVLLAGAGGLLGVGVAFLGLWGLVRFGPDELTRLADPRIDPALLGFVVALSLATGLLVGLAPAASSFRTAARSVASALRDGSRGAVSSLAGGLLRRVFVVAEVALAIVLLVGAGLLLRSFDRLLAVDLGMQSRSVLTVDLSLPRSFGDGTAVGAFYRDLVDRVATLPGVAAAGAISDPLLPALPNSGTVSIEGSPDPPDEERIEVTIDAATPTAFETLGVPLLAGRGLTEGDDPEAAVVVLVNEAMARRYWSSPAEAVGRRFKFGDQDSEGDWFTVAGVVGDVRRTAFEKAARPSAYFSHGQWSMRSMTLLVRTAGDPEALVPTIRGVVRELDPDLPLAGTGTLEARLDERVAGRRFHTLLLAAFAGLALFLAVVGVVGVVSQLVTHRTREIGVRMALGAGRLDVGRWVLARGLAPVALGVVVGLAGAAALARTLRSLLFEVGTLDVSTYLAVPMLLLGLAAVALLVPALRAVRVEPARALRAE